MNRYLRMQILLTVLIKRHQKLESKNDKWGLSLFNGI